MDTLASNHDQEGSDQEASQASVRWGQHHFSAILFAAAQKKNCSKSQQNNQFVKVLKSFDQFCQRFLHQTRRCRASKRAKPRSCQVGSEAMVRVVG